MCRMAKLDASSTFPAGHRLRADVKITLSGGDTDVGVLYIEVPE